MHVGSCFLCHPLVFIINILNTSNMDKENIKPKRRKKGYRKFHDRRKNGVWKRQAKAKEKLQLQGEVTSGATTQRNSQPDSTPSDTTMARHIKGLCNQ